MNWTQLLCLTSLMSLAGMASSIKAVSPDEGYPAQSDAAPIMFYVSPDGNDAWSGKLPDPANDDGPFLTIERARQAARAAAPKRPDDAPVRVILREATYYLSEPLEFGPEDSGAGSERYWFSDITYAAAPGETVVFSGGRRLTGGTWGEINGLRVWVIDVPEAREGQWYFRQLFINGERRPRTRLPKTGVYDIESLPDDPSFSRRVQRFVFSETDIEPWKNLSDVDVVVPVRWMGNRLRIKEVDVDNRMVTFDRRTCCSLNELYAKKPCSYWVENVLEALDTPGQWYLDRTLGKLYILPKPDEDMESAEIVAPRLSTIMRVAGNPRAPVKFLNFDGLTFAHTEWEPPEDWAGSAAGPEPVPAAVAFEHALNCSLTNSFVGNAGTHGVDIREGCLGLSISGNTITDLGASGVCLRDDSARTRVADNEISHIGKIHLNAVGVRAGHSSGNQIIYNHIHHTHYCGLSIGWGRNNRGVGNVVEHNLLHDIGQKMLSDMGGIYMLGDSPGTRVRYNVVRDVRSRDRGAWGIYTDDNSAHMLVENNLVYRCSSAPVFQHLNHDITVCNNILAFGDICQAQSVGQLPWFEFSFRHNLVYYSQGHVVQHWQNPESGSADFNYNLYWNTSGAALDFGEKTFDEWQAAGLDRNSIVADPLFVDPENGDFRLKPGSPAEGIGFRPWDISNVGPRHPQE